MHSAKNNTICEWMNVHKIWMHEFTPPNTKKFPRQLFLLGEGKTRLFWWQLTPKARARRKEKNTRKFGDCVNYNLSQRTVLLGQRPAVSVAFSLHTWPGAHAAFHYSVIAETYTVNCITQTCSQVADFCECWVADPCPSSFFQLSLSHFFWWVL